MRPHTQTHITAAFHPPSHPIPSFPQPRRPRRRTAQPAPRGKGGRREQRLGCAAEPAPGSSLSWVPNPHRHRPGAGTRQKLCEGLLFASGRVVRSPRSPLSFFAASMPPLPFPSPSILRLSRNKSYFAEEAGETSTSDARNYADTAGHY
ncbi:hypothetical protein LZ31DRAFT_184929 [Colletotrichum somersetense]|nr:hypothetical protein LZ31DRAFT_184929 [Colletotrichum somersetense]